MVNLSRRRSLTQAAGAVAGVALTACEPVGRGAGPSAPQAKPNEPAPPSKPIVILDTVITVPALDPAVGTSGNTLIKFGMSETLTRVGRSGDMEPWLAASWRNLDPLRWEVKVRDGVSFWDGSVVDAAAVKASLERAAAKNAEARVKLSMAGIDVVDPRTLIIRTQGPNALLPIALGHPVLAIHNAKVAEALGDEAFAARPVLTGPFRATEYKTSESLTLTRHDAYWGGKPFLPGFLVKYANDANSRVLAIQSGDADLIFDVPTQSLRTLRAQPGVHLPEIVSDYQYFIVMNARTFPTDDPRVRRAISLHLDRRALVTQVLEGAHDLATDVYAPIYSWTLRNGYPTEPARAPQLLDEAGWQRGSDGIRRKDGRPLAFTLLHYPQRPDLQPLGIAVQAQLRTLGITTELRSVDQIAQAVKGPDWGGAMWFMTTAQGGDPLALMDYFFRPGGNEVSNFTHPDLPGLIDQVRTTMDQSQRSAALRRMQDLLAEHLPIVPLVAIKWRFAVSDRLKSVQVKMPAYLVVDANFGR